MTRFDTIVFKVAPSVLWQEAVRVGQFVGSADDIRDGFIHFSTAAQLPGTLDKHFRGQADLVLLRVAADDLGAGLRLEPSRGGDLFPHLYGPLSVAAVQSVTALTLAADGRVQVPEGAL